MMQSNPPSNIPLQDLFQKLNPNRKEYFECRPIISTGAIFDKFVIEFHRIEWPRIVGTIKCIICYYIASLITLLDWGQEGGIVPTLMIAFFPVFVNDLSPTLPVGLLLFLTILVCLSATIGTLGFAATTAIMTSFNAAHPGDSLYIAVWLCWTFIMTYVFSYTYLLSSLTRFPALVATLFANISIALGIGVGQITAPFPYFYLFIIIPWLLLTSLISLVIGQIFPDTSNTRCNREIARIMDAYRTTLGILNDIMSGSTSPSPHVPLTRYLQKDGPALWKMQHKSSPSPQSSPLIVVNSLASTWYEWAEMQTKKTRTVVGNLSFDWYYSVDDPADLYNLYCAVEDVTRETTGMIHLVDHLDTINTILSDSLQSPGFHLLFQQTGQLDSLPLIQQDLAKFYSFISPRLTTICHVLDSRQVPEQALTVDQLKQPLPTSLFSNSWNLLIQSRQTFNSSKQPIQMDLLSSCTLYLFNCWAIASKIEQVSQLVVIILEKRLTNPGKRFWWGGRKHKAGTMETTQIGDDFTFQKLRDLNINNTFRYGPMASQPIDPRGPSTAWQPTPAATLTTFGQTNTVDTLSPPSIYSTPPTFNPLTPVPYSTWDNLTNGLYRVFYNEASKFALRAAIGVVFVCMWAFFPFTGVNYVVYNGYWSLVAYISASFRPTAGKGIQISFWRIMAGILGGVLGIIACLPAGGKSLPAILCIPLPFLFPMYYYMMYTDIDYFPDLSLSTYVVIAYGNYRQANGDLNAITVAVIRLAFYILGVVFATIMLLAVFPRLARNLARVNTGQALMQNCAGLIKAMVLGIVSTLNWSKSTDFNPDEPLDYGLWTKTKASLDDALDRSRALLDDTESNIWESQGEPDMQRPWNTAMFLEINELIRITTSITLSSINVFDCLLQTSNGVGPEFAKEASTPQSRKELDLMIPSVLSLVQSLGNSMQILGSVITERRPLPKSLLPNLEQQYLAMTAQYDKFKQDFANSHQSVTFQIFESILADALLVFLRVVRAIENRVERLHGVVEPLDTIIPA